jgi:DNA-binding transcriptional regulator YdaS (Cro superfamily)
MAEIVNLRQARKAKQRGAAERQAAANRAQHGETKGEKLRRQREAERLTRTVDGAKRDDD